MEYTCPQCGSDWRFAEYDLEYARAAFSQSLHERPSELWRYQELLPVSPPYYSSGLSEGWTPLMQASQLGLLLGLDHLYIKDERQGPTRSFKDRQAAVSTSILVNHHLKEAVICSTGNVAIAFSAACARAGIKLWAFLTSLVPPEKMHEVAIYGTKVIKVTGTYDEAKRLAAQYAKDRLLYFDRGVRSIAAVESMKTIAFEIAEQLSQDDAPVTGSRWRSPDWYVQAVSGGIGPVGVLKGFHELYKMRLVDRIPSIAVIQTDGCAPMVHAWKAGLEQAEPVMVPTTHITTLTTGDPGRSYTHLQSQMQKASGGVMESVSDEEAFEALHLIAKLEGLSAEPAAAAAFAGLIKLARSDVFKREEIIIVNCSGHTMPVDPHLLSAGWSKDVAINQFALPEQPIDGLLGALDTLREDFTRDILIVDDQVDARRLIRRVLEAQGSYKVFEAENGMDALRHIENMPPDLVILDLMMPEMDGFEVLETIKRMSDQRDIPIIVITAKELMTKERASLEGRIEGLLTKGDFLGEDLVDQVDKLLD